MLYRRLWPVFASLPLNNHFGFFKSKITFRVMDVVTKLEVQNMYIGLDPVEFGIASIAHAA